MTERIKIINWLLVVDVLICIPAHRLLLSQAKAGSVSGLAGDVFRISLISYFLFFMAACAGLAGYYWKKVSADPVSVDKLPKYPKKSLIAAAVATVVFTVYWGVQIL